MRKHKTTVPHFLVVVFNINLKYFFSNRYPRLGGGIQLRQAIASYCGGATVPENVLVCNGSDDALVLICHALLGIGKSVLVPSPSYEHFCVNALATGNNY